MLECKSKRQREGGTEQRREPSLQSTISGAMPPLYRLQIGASTLQLTESRDVRAQLTFNKDVLTKYSTA